MRTGTNTKAFAKEVSLWKLIGWKIIGVRLTITNTGREILRPFKRSTGLTQVGITQRILILTHHLMEELQIETGGGLATDKSQETNKKVTGIRANGFPWMLLMPFRTRLAKRWKR